MKLWERLFRHRAPEPLRAWTEYAGWHGGYLCKCGNPWLIGADKCMYDGFTQQELDDLDNESV